MEDKIRDALVTELALAKNITELEYAQGILKFYDMGLIEVNLDDNGRPTAAMLPAENKPQAISILQNDNQRRLKEESN